MTQRLTLPYLPSGSTVKKGSVDGIKRAVDLAVKTPYDPEADIEWLSGCGNRIQMKPGMFYLVYPDDGHKPCCHEKEQTSYRKVVVKIKIDKLLHGVPAMERTAVYGKGDRRWI